MQEQFNQVKQYIHNHKAAIEADLLSMVALESTEAEKTAKSPFGDKVGDALETIRAIGEKLGFKCRNHGGYYTTIDFGEVSEPNQAVGILCHADVVPLGEGWNYNPLGQVADGRIYGRGTLDDKGPAIASLYAMAAVKNSGITLTRPVRLVVGGNEETSSRCMKKYNETDIPLWGGFSPDGDFPVIFAEKGIAMHSQDLSVKSNLIEEISAGTAVNAVPGKAEAILKTDNLQLFDTALKNYTCPEKITLEKTADGKIKITAVGKSAHGSTPQKGESAVKILIEFLNILFNMLKIDDPLIAALRNIYELFCTDHNGAKAGISCSDQVSGSLTLNLGILNYHSESLHIELDMRYPVTANYEEIKAKLDKATEKYQIRLQCTEHKKPLYVDKNSPLVQALVEVYKSTGRKDTEPLAIGGGTYCRTMENFVAFGPIGADDADTMHQADEYIEREHLLFLAEVYAKAIVRLAK